MTWKYSSPTAADGQLTRMSSRGSLESWTASCLREEDSGNIAEGRVEPSMTAGTAGGNLRLQLHLEYLEIILHNQKCMPLNGDNKQGEADLPRSGSSRRIGMVIPGTILYKELFQSICTYAVNGCAISLRRCHQIQLLSARRQALIRTTKSYTPWHQCRTLYLRMFR